MIADAPFEQKWTLQGRLCGQWAADLREKWADTRSSRTGRNSVVDLEDVITVDQTGERALLEMAMEGARLIARRAYMKSVLERLQAAPHERNSNHVDH
jgi:anti-anti-sigma regulatory factor